MVESSGLRGAKPGYSHGGCTKGRPGWGFALRLPRSMAAVLAPMAQAEWLPPVAISATGDYAASPHVALDSEGNATAVWDRWNGSDTVVESSFRPADSPGARPKTSRSRDWKGNSFPAPTMRSPPQVVVDRNGNLTVLWERDPGP